MIHIYSDGGCSGNPGPGGWAYVIIGERGMDSGELGMGNGELGAGSGEPSIIAENWGAEMSTTNNRMELLAVISALEVLPEICSGTETIKVYSDSQYVQKGMTIWIKEWKARGWKTSGKKPVKNQDLWLHLDNLAAKHNIAWVWVKGHAGNIFNERCDVLTQKAIASLR